MTDQFDRRSFLARVGAVAGAGALGTILGAPAAGARGKGPGAPAGDNDAGPVSDWTGGADPEQQRARIAARTDADSGAQADYRGEGRGPRRTEPSGLTDNDMGATKDAAEFGRGPPRGE